MDPKTQVINGNFQVFGFFLIIFKKCLKSVSFEHVTESKWEKVGIVKIIKRFLIPIPDSRTDTISASTITIL